MGKGHTSKGFLGRLLTSFKSQPLTLTEAGKKQAPMRKGQPAKKAAKKAAQKAPPAPLTPRERQVRELKTMFDIGTRNPERLARIISHMLQEANAKDEEAQLKYERLIWEKVEKRGQKKDKGGDAGEK